MPRLEVGGCASPRTPWQQVDGGHEHQPQHQRAPAAELGGELLADQHDHGRAQRRPHRLPRPPITTASRAMADTSKPRSAGETKRDWATQSEPAAPAAAPAMQNTAYLGGNVR